MQINLTVSGSQKEGKNVLIKIFKNVKCDLDNQLQTRSCFKVHTLDDRSIINDN